jgi:hypothetical protein
MGQVDGEGYEGACEMTRLLDDEGRWSGLRINRADPRILIAAELLTATFLMSMPGVSLAPPPDDRNGTPFWRGAVLTIRGVNQTVIYRIGEYVPGVRCYEAEWPD